MAFFLKSKEKEERNEKTFTALGSVEVNTKYSVPFILS
jgi:hypothetical protein